MKTKEQVHKLLKQLNAERVARDTGLHANTVRKIRKDPDSDVMYSVIERLSAYLEKTLEV